jgi:hypothetical protein
MAGADTVSESGMSFIIAGCALTLAFLAVIFLDDGNASVGQETRRAVARFDTF